MLIVTGGAGFIGSNLVKALNARGRDDIIVVDDLTDGRKFANLAGAQDRRLSRPRRVPPGDHGRDGFRPGRCRLPPGRLHRHHRVERAVHARHELRLLEGGVRVVSEARRAADLRLLRRPCMAAAPTSARTPPTFAPSMSMAGRSSSSTSGWRGKANARPAWWGSDTSTSTGRTRRTRAGWRASSTTSTASSATPAWCACSGHRTASATASTAAISSSSATSSP